MYPSADGNVNIETGKVTLSNKKVLQLIRPYYVYSG